ncbi:MAG: MBL fold metallo-hydrolase [Flavipsychrobacter sp.]
MLHIECFTFNAFQENTYVIHNNGKDCWIIDPGMYDAAEVTHLKKYIADNQLKPKAIINTHTHIDHIFGVAALKEAYNIPFGIHAKDAPVLNGAAGAAMLFGFTFGKAPEPDFFITEGNSPFAGLEDVQVLFTPGHSPGSISFYSPNDKWLVAGDVLFNGSIGRTDLPGGDFNTLISSIKTQLFVLPEETVVYSGHGPNTTIRNEKLYNPFLQG